MLAVVRAQMDNRVKIRWDATTLETLPVAVLTCGWGGGCERS